MICIWTSLVLSGISDSQIRHQLLPNFKFLFSHCCWEVFLAMTWSCYFFTPCSRVCLCHPDCETLIRRMLVVDPTKRITISQIKQHKWMQADPSLQQQQSLSFSMQNYNSNLGDYNEQVLGIMQTLGIDRQRTVEVSSCPLHTSPVTTRMPTVTTSAVVAHSVTGLDLVSQHKIFTALLDFVFFSECATLSP